MKKKVVSVLLCLSFLFSLLAVPTSAVAAPRWTDQSTVSLVLDCFDGFADCLVRVVGGSGTTSIDGTFELRKIYSSNSYGVVKYESMSSNSTTLTWGKSIKIDPGYTYKLVVRATVHRNGTLEPVGDEMEQYYA